MSERISHGSDGEKSDNAASEDAEADITDVDAIVCRWCIYALITLLLAAITIGIYLVGRTSKTKDTTTLDTSSIVWLSREAGNGLVGQRNAIMRINVNKGTQKAFVWMPSKDAAAACKEKKWKHCSNQVTAIHDVTNEGHAGIFACGTNAGKPRCILARDSDTLVNLTTLPTQTMVESAISPRPDRRFLSLYDADSKTLYFVGRELRNLDRVTLSRTPLKALLSREVDFPPSQAPFDTKLSNMAEGSELFHAQSQLSFAFRSQDYFYMLFNEPYLEPDVETNKGSDADLNSRRDLTMLRGRIGRVCHQDKGPGKWTTFLKARIRCDSMNHVAAAKLVGESLYVLCTREFDWAICKWNTKQMDTTFIGQVGQDRIWWHEPLASDVQWHSALINNSIADVYSCRTEANNGPNHVKYRVTSIIHKANSIFSGSRDKETVFNFEIDESTTRSVAYVFHRGGRVRIFGKESDRDACEYSPMETHPDELSEKFIRTKLIRVPNKSQPFIYIASETKVQIFVGRDPNQLSCPTPVQ